MVERRVSSEDQTTSRVDFPRSGCIRDRARVLSVTMSTYTMSVAAEIRAEMARQNITQKRLGELIGKPQTTITRWVTGQTPLRLDDLSLIAEGLDVSVVDLVRKAGDAMANTRCTLPSEIGSASSQVSALEGVAA